MIFYYRVNKDGVAVLYKSSMCCSEIKRALDDGNIIHFGQWRKPETRGYYDSDFEPYIALVSWKEWVTRMYAQPDYRISHCPFCGTAIEVQEHSKEKADG